MFKILKIITQENNWYILFKNLVCPPKTLPKTNKLQQACKGTQTLDNSNATDQIGSVYLIHKKVYYNG